MKYFQLRELSKDIAWKLVLSVFGVVLVTDQVTKYYAVHYLDSHFSRVVLPGLFNLTLVFNKGAAFGMFSTLPDLTRRLALTGVFAIAIVVVLRLLLEEARNDKVAQFALGGIVGGALGNLLDRIRFDSVVDFLDFYVGDSHWPAFNVADSAICVGVFVILLKFLFAGKGKQAEE